MWKNSFLLLFCRNSVRITTVYFTVDVSLENIKTEEEQQQMTELNWPGCTICNLFPCAVTGKDRPNRRGAVAVAYLAW